MSEKGRYTYLDHTGDIGIDAEAPDLPALFATCARALFEILSGEDPGIEPRESLEIELEESERDLLLLRWLKELHQLHESGGWLFAGFRVSLAERPGPRFGLRARVTGERLDPARHHLETEIKAVTYHQLTVRKDAGGAWRARVIFDI